MSRLQGSKRYLISIIILISTIMVVALALDSFGIISKGYSIALKDLSTLNVERRDVLIIGYTYIVFGYFQVLIISMQLVTNRIKSKERLINKSIFGIVIAIVLSVWFVITDFGVYHNILFVHIPFFVIEILILLKLKD